MDWPCFFENDSSSWPSPSRESPFLSFTFSFCSSKLHCRKSNQNWRSWATSVLELSECTSYCKSEFLSVSNNEDGCLSSCNGREIQRKFEIGVSLKMCLLEAKMDCGVLVLRGLFEATIDWGWLQKCRTSSSRRTHHTVLSDSASEWSSTRSCSATTSSGWYRPNIFDVEYSLEHVRPRGFATMNSASQENSLWFEARVKRYKGRSSNDLAIHSQFKESPNFCELASISWMEICISWNL